ncbi:hypothetical protein [Collimonas sp.]|jgi:hypothetical protein|uniref:hypothetical protein n=1 Tax=Collimonas sp. TaxID=1963772 RepID=UPI002BFD33F9|nr:hypothetical protein [Collimonas sp.]HWW04565.1 hypothetical protein [Collimonas sp.]
MNSTNSIALMLLTLRYALARRVGWPGAVGVLLLGFTLLAALAIAPRWEKNAGEIKSQTRVALVDLNRARLEHRVQPKTSEQLRRFTAWFPTIDHNASDLRRLLEQAQLAKLDLTKGEYHVSDADGAAFVSYEVVLPVKASYDTLRSFIAGVLNAIPNASLAELHIERAAVNSTIQDARIHFTFVYRGV